MKTKECPACAMDVDSNSKECPICGYEFGGTSGGLQLVALILVLIFLYLIFS
jgi:hypothetical protein